MKRSFGKIAATAVAILARASFALAPGAAAAGGGRGGGGGGGGGHHAGGGGGGAHAGGGGRGGGGGGRKNVQANHNTADVRTNNVRNTSVNNVNVKRNTNVNVNVDRGGCCNGGWDNDYHPVATAVAVTAAVGVTSAIVGSMVRSVPTGCVPVNYGGMIYQQCGGTWYQPQGSQFVVINPPY
jgi:hypothetical protein